MHSEAGAVTAFAPHAKHQRQLDLYSLLWRRSVLWNSSTGLNFRERFWEEPGDTLRLGLAQAVYEFLVLGLFLASCGSQLTSA